MCQAPVLVCLTQDGFGGTLQRATDTLNPTFAWPRWPSLSLSPPHHGRWGCEHPYTFHFVVSSKVFLVASQFKIIVKHYIVWIYHHLFATLSLMDIWAVSNMGLIGYRDAVMSFGDKYTPFWWERRCLTRSEIAVVGDGEVHQSNFIRYC